ncbi:polysaccharide deacetylase family protein [Fundicoccus culcitae]|uniref:Polysaccharide deacetylase family protein n=1 Tax=Fundicoccus culcitae TaxID=2969821 RepID=A0ABY5P8A2_9LACT|nr:polysaccharide deacetylase family protein [Fundicoccus culcitae]UUX34618.1 polysaccharide deacetylase family protein [Fundicoccus culcitae]
MRKIGNNLGKNRWVVIALEIVLLVILVVFIFNQFNSTIGSLRRAQASVQKLYVDNDFTELNLDVTQAEIDQATEQINNVTGSNQDVLLSQIEVAQNQYYALNQLSQYYEVSHPKELIQSAEPLKLKAEVAPQQVAESKQTFMANLTDSDSELDQHFLQLYDQAYTQGTELQALEASFTDLPTDLRTKEELLNAVEGVQFIEEELDRLDDTINLDAVQSEFDVYCQDLSQDIVEWDHSIENLTEEELAYIGKSPTLSQSFIGTPLNYLSKRVALTFDDGPNEAYTLQVLDILDHYDVVGTFFVMGAYVDEYPQVANEIVKRGHVIGNHTYNHFDLGTLSDAQVMEQINWTQDSIKEATGATPELLRFPFGKGGPHILSLTEDLDSILWTIDTLDWKTHDAELIHQETLANLQPQSIILMHDTHQATPDALKTLIPILLDMGYTFVTPNETGVNIPYYSDNSHL